MKASSVSTNNGLFIKIRWCNSCGKHHVVTHEPQFLHKFVQSDERMIYIISYTPWSAEFVIRFDVIKDRVKRAEGLLYEK